MSRAACFSVLWVAVACTACAGRVGVEFDPAEDFAGYRSWDWLVRKSEPLDTEGVDREGLHALIVAEVEHELELRGYPRSDAGDPDFFVTYHAEIRREVVDSTETGAMQFVASLHNSPSYAVSSVEKNVQAFEISTLAIDVADGSDKQLVWRGAYERRVRGSFRPYVKLAVARILEHFPPLAETVAQSD